MTQVAIVRAVGDGGYQEPRTGTYISSKRDTIVAYTDWVENLVNHEKVKLVEGPYEGSEYGQFVNVVAENNGDQEVALEAYRKTLPIGNKDAEKIRTVESPADLEAQVKTEKATAEAAPKATGRQAAAATSSKTPE